MALCVVFMLHAVKERFGSTFSSSDSCGSLAFLFIIFMSM